MQNDDCVMAPAFLHPRAGLTANVRRAEPRAAVTRRNDLIGMETIMKKIALAAVAVLGLGLAACQDNAPDNAVSTENTIETEAAADTNAALDANLGTTADNALDAAGNAVENAGNSIENAADDIANGQDNVAGQ
jgi:hypothetical protein